MKEKLETFVSSHQEEYGEDAYQYIMENYKQFIGENQVFDILRQLFSKYGFIKKENDMYQKSFEMINKLYGIDRNIIEVASGCYPRFAEIIDENQRKNNKGTLTIYDPRIVLDNLGKVKIVKDEFTMQTDIKDCSLIVALAPCEATETIIQKANLENQEFFIALCGCNHTSRFCYSNDSWYDELVSLAEQGKSKGDKIYVDSFDKKYNYPYPIIYKKKATKE